MWRSGGLLGQSDHEMVEFLILGGARRGNSKTATLDFWREDRIVQKTSRETLLEFFLRK